jgi:hypothetical protein
VDKKTWLLLGVGAVLVYFAYRKIADVGAAAGAALTATGEKIGGGIYELFHPNTTGDMYDYTVHFSNGAHSIPASQVDSAGRFTYNGQRFIMRDQKDARGVYLHWAFAA